VQIFDNDGTGQFSKGQTIGTPENPIPEGTAIVSADFNHDGIDDLAVACQNPGLVFILTGVGPGHFAIEGPPVYVGRTSFTLTVANVHGDPDHPDLAVVNTGGNSVSVMYNTSDPTKPYLPPRFVASREFRPTQSVNGQLVPLILGPSGSPPGCSGTDCRSLQPAIASTTW
jgi:hypothetical protein